MTGAAVRKNDHAVAEHVPGDGLRSDGASLGIPKSGLKIGLAATLPEPERRNLAVVEKRYERD
jgi:hypothetical protein